jgi:hypothetical protein
MSTSPQFFFFFLHLSFLCVNSFWKKHSHVSKPCVFPYTATTLVRPHHWHGEGKVGVVPVFSGRKVSNPWHPGRFLPRFNLKESAHD